MGSFNFNRSLFIGCGGCGVLQVSQQQSASPSPTMWITFSVPGSHDTRATSTCFSVDAPVLKR